MSAGESSADGEVWIRPEIIPINVWRKQLSRRRESLCVGCAMLFVFTVRNLPFFSSKWVNNDEKSRTPTLDRQNVGAAL